MSIELIREQIRKKGISQRWLAQEMGIHKSTLNRFLTGRTVLGGEHMVALLKILKLKPEDVRAS